MFVWALAPPKIGSCSTDLDCTVYSKAFPSTSGLYICIDNACLLSSTAGARCSQSSQCLQYQYANRLLKQNQSLLVDDPTGYLNNICHPQHCTLDSLCIVNPNPFDSNMTTDGGCCLGASAGMTCNLFSDGNSNCDINKQCVPNGDSKPTLQCINVSKTSTQWIGVIITLIGAATLNIGLNLQKLALRKRFEKRIKSDESEKEQALRRLSSITVSLSQLYKKASNASFVSNKKKEEIEMVQSESESQDTRQNSFGSMERQPRQLGQLRQSQIHSGDKPEFQTKLGMVGLLKNPRWMLGFLVFTIGNICNVIALQFAPQSLVAPLGSISLVVNVIIAPFMNNEKWSYRDVLGVILIVGGSSLVVAFAGSNQHDYCLAVLLSLFRKAATIVFLSFTGTMIIVIYLMIVFIEKNLDLTETRQDTMLINQALDEGRITAVDPVEPEQISREHRKSRLLADTNGLVVEIDEAMSPGGIAQRRLIVSERRASTDVKEEPAFEPKKKDDDTKSTKSMALVFTIGNEQHVSEELEIESPVEKEPPILQQRKSVEFVLPRKPFFKRMVDKLPFIEQFRAIQLIPRLEKPISLESVWVRMVLPFSYASLGGLMATLTVLFAKATINLLTLSIFGQDNQYVHFDSWVLTAVTVITAVSQIYWINMGLARYDALLQIPVFYVVWTLFDVIGGGIYYKEFDGMSALQLGLFCLGVSVIFSGVVVLSTRLKALQDEEKELNDQI